MLIVGHRGCAGSAPENTLAAFRAAVAGGVDMVEFDVRRLTDGTLILLHDRRLHRTTNGRGSVYAKTWTDLAAYDAGGWFAPRYRGEYIPMLEQVLDALPRSVGANIEVKTDGDPCWRAELPGALAAALRRTGHHRRILVSSFNHVFLKRLRMVDSSIRTGALVLPLRDAGRLPSALARRWGVSAYICSPSRLRKRLVFDAHRHGIEVLVYGVNTASQISRPCRFGIDGVITDFPAQIRAIIASHQLTTSRRTKA